MEETLKSLSEKIESKKEEMAEILAELIKIPAIGPENGGKGEFDKAEKLLEIIKDWPFDKIERYDTPDKRVKSGKRPNILAFYYGKEGENSPRIWILTHLDVVPPGDLSKWDTPPFEPVIRDGKVFGRGSEDNGQSLVASLFAVKSMMELGIRPRYTIILSFVSDEESGSKYGLEWLIRTHPELFKKTDIALVPDGGNEDGTFIEIAEKSILWLKIKVKGKQVHASMPEKGLNAHRIAVDITNELDRFLHQKYNKKDSLFDPPESTFEPTMSKNPSDATNIIPGEYELTFDCRVLPTYNIDDILSDAKKIAEKIKQKHKKNNLPEIEFEITQRLDAPPPTPKDSKLVKLLTERIRQLRGKEATVGGIGGGTFAASFRKLGIPSVVWATLDELAHQPNEYAKINNMVEDTKIFAAFTL